MEEIPDLISMNQLNEPTDRALAAGRRLYEIMRSRYARDSGDVSRFAKTATKAKRPNTRRAADFVEAVPPPRPKGVAPAKPANRTDSHGTGPYGDFDAKRAKAVDLVELPAIIEGTSCSNCEYFTPTGDALFVTGSDGYCDHRRVRMHVAGSWCCNEWGRADAPLARPGAEPAAQFRRSRGVSRYATEATDCGHDSGGFSLRNTCGSRRGSSSSRWEQRASGKRGKAAPGQMRLFDGDHKEKERPRATSQGRLFNGERKKHGESHERKHEERKESRGWSLKQESAVGKKSYKPDSSHTGKGHTGYLFDMKRGDLPGQSSFLDRESETSERRPDLRHESREKRLERLPGGKDPELRKRLGEYREQRSGERREDLERQRAKRRAKESGKSASREAKLLQRLAGGRKRPSREPEEDYDTRRVREQEAQRQAAESERAKAKAEREERKGPYGRSRHRSSRHSSRYAKAGDADDCGHRTITGHFDFGNTCQTRGRRATLAEPAGHRAAPPALGGRGESGGEPSGPPLRPGSQAAKQQPLGKPQWIKSGGRWVPVGRGPKVSREDEEWHAQQLREQESGKKTSRPMKPGVQEESAGKPLKKNGDRQSLGQDIRGSRERGELYNRDPGFDRKLRKRLARVEDLMGKMPKTGTWGNKEWMKLASERREIIDTLKHAKNGGGRGPGGDGGKLAGVEEPHPSGFDRDYRRELLDKAMARLQGGRSKTAERLRQGRGESLARRHPEKYARPGDVVDMNTSSIHVDPERFQFKGGHAAGTGSVGSLAGAASFNPKLAGAITVWRDPADGKTYVINGHNRLDLAKRMGVGKIRTEFIDAKDEREARASGAITNIAEGRGTSIDAAKFFRDTEMTRDDAKSLGITMREKIASEGLDLAALDKGLFDKVVQGAMTPARGAIIGGSGLSRVQQRAIYEQLKKLGRRGEVNDRTLRELMDNARHAGSVHREERDLFGSSVQEQSLAIYRSQVQGDIKDTLLKDKNLFKLVSKSKSAQALAERGRSHIDVEETGKVGQEAATLLGVFDTLKNRSGPVASALNQAAERVARGESRSTVVKEARAEIARAIEGLFGGPEAEVA